MANSPGKNVSSAEQRWGGQFIVLVFFRLMMLFCLWIPAQTSVAEPIVILEYRGADTVTEGEGSVHPFRTLTTPPTIRTIKMKL